MGGEGCRSDSPVREDGWPQALRAGSFTARHSPAQASKFTRNHMYNLTALITLLALCSAATLAAAGAPAPRETGYRGIWFTLGQFTEYGDKYSGGLGTYTANHVPVAVYAPKAEKTFFVYGGARKGTRHLLIMAP